MIDLIDLAEFGALALASFASGYIAGKWLITGQRFGELST